MSIARQEADGMKKVLALAIIGFVVIFLLLASVGVSLWYMWSSNLPYIGTLKDYGFFLILLGPSGGPDNVGMVPGLYMFTEAFYSQRYGYACALGMILFFVILIITILYQKYVRVEK